MELNQFKADLHIHTNYSDGTFSPEKVVQTALSKDLSAIAITDHDTVSGNEEAIIEGKRQRLEVIPAIELSISHNSGEMHLLGYFIDYKSKELNEKLYKLREHRKQRNPKIIEKLKQLGIEVDLQQIRKNANNGNVGRPHIAAAMLEKGYVSTIKEAFDLYLKKGGPAYVPKESLSPEEGIRLIETFGGVPVLAHPYTLGLSNEELNKLVSRLKEIGLKGIEVYYLSHRNNNKFYEKLADIHGLCKTGGSDFHGFDRPDIEIGTGLGSSRLSYSLVEEMKKFVPHRNFLNKLNISNLFHAG